MKSCQQKFGEKILETLKQRGQIGNFSSETGSGKTMILLATLCN
jgi:superfamily II DNA or RNA helicase